jgi:urease accessory protein
MSADCRNLVSLSPPARYRILGLFNFFKNQKFLPFTLLGTVLFFTALIEPAAAHHMMGGRTPATFLAGFLSGLAHPVIGLDHFAFVVAVGLLAALSGRRGAIIPAAFILATLAGTGIHLLNFNLPLPEVAIAAFLLLSGILLAGESRPNLFLLAGTAAAAGIFNGYAYGEAIVGAEMTPLLAYLAGFALIQLAIAFAAYQVGQFALNRANERPSRLLRVAGFILAGVGAAFLSSAVFSL